MNQDQFRALQQQVCDLLGVPFDEDGLLQYGETDIALRLTDDGAVLLYLDVGVADPDHLPTCTQLMLEQNLYMAVTGSGVFALNPDGNGVVLMLRLSADEADPRHIAGCVQQFVDTNPQQREELFQGAVIARSALRPLVAAAA